MDFTSRRFHLRHWTHPILLLILSKGWEKLQSLIWRIHELILKKYLELWHPCTFLKNKHRQKIYSSNKSHQIYFLKQKSMNFIHYLVFNFLWINKPLFTTSWDTIQYVTHSPSVPCDSATGMEEPTSNWEHLSQIKAKSRSCWLGPATKVKRRASSISGEMLGPLLGIHFFLRTGDLIASLVILIRHPGFDPQRDLGKWWQASQWLSSYTLHGR